MTPAPTATSAPSATATLASPPTPLHPQSAPSREKKFNDDEERSLYGALEGEHEYVSPWLGAQALGLATALVMGSAALGMWGVAKVMGVKNVRISPLKHLSRRATERLGMWAMVSFLCLPNPHRLCVGCA